MSSGVEIRNSLVDCSSAQSKLKVARREPLTWYSCGPTVYDSSHLGHARTYVCTDVMRRVITDYFNTPVSYAVGITDVDDKIINKAKQLGYTSWSEVQRMVRKLEDDFFRDMDRLNVLRPDSVLRVSEHIPDIQAYVGNLVSKNSAYAASDGVYFDYSSLKHEYDKFGCTNIPDFQEIEQGASEEGAAYQNSAAVHQKRNPKDFALWKVSRTVGNDATGGDPFTWESPWGAGRPGWHIECSAMTHALFGTHLDIHSGGVDLKFPHHTNEIAQWYV